MAELAGKVAIVTGAGAGIGRALAIALADRGARVGLFDIDEEGLAETAARLPAGSSSRHRCDVRDPDQCSGAVTAVVADWGGVDILINNAGLSHRSLFADTSLEVIRRVMEVNFFGAVHCTQAALPSLIERRGLIVALSSVAGFAPLVGRTGYAASKHALHGFFDSLRSELIGHGVGVLIACPSFTRTTIDRNALAGNGGLVGEEKQTVGTIATPEQVATEIVGAILRRRKRLVLSPVGKLSYWISRLSPDLYERLMLKKLRGELEPDAQRPRPKPD